MDSFKEREKGFESKFAHDAETRFRIEARANRLIGLWVAQKLGRFGDEAESYAREVMKSDFEEAGREDVFRKVSQDLDGIADEAEIRRHMENYLKQAEEELLQSS